MEFLVNGLHLHVRALHGNSRSHVLFVFQLRIALENLPAGKLIARTKIRSNGNFRTLFCRGDICRTIYHFNCMELCILRVQGNIAFRHLEGDPVLVDLLAQINAGRFPIFKLAAVLVRCPSFDRLPLKSLVCCYVIHLNDNSSIVGVDGVVLLVIRGQSHALVRHGKGDCGVLLICKRDALSSPAGKLCVFSVCCGHGDLFARKGSLQFCTLPLQLDGCIFCSIDVVAHFRRNAHILCRFCWDGRNIRVNCFSICFITGVVNIITSVGNALCNSAVLVLFKKGRRAGAFNFHIATDRRIALAFDLHTFRAVYGKVSANSRPSIVIRYNGQLPGAGNIYIALNRCKFLTGNRHIIRIFNCQDTVKSAILQCKILAIQLYIHARCIDRQKSVDGSI